MASYPSNLRAQELLPRGDFVVHHSRPWNSRMTTPLRVPQKRNGGRPFPFELSQKIREKKEKTVIGHNNANQPARNSRPLKIVRKDQPVPPHQPRQPLIKNPAHPPSINIVRAKLPPPPRIHVPVPPRRVPLAANTRELVLKKTARLKHAGKFPKTA